MLESSVPSSCRVLRKRTREVKRSELSSVAPRDEKRKRVAWECSSKCEVNFS